MRESLDSLEERVEMLEGTYGSGRESLYSLQERVEMLEGRYDSDREYESQDESSCSQERSGEMLEDETEPKIQVLFTIPYTTSYGEDIQIRLLDETGHDAAGTALIPMTWTMGHVWSAYHVFTFNSAAVRAQTAPFLFRFEVVKHGSGEILRVDCPRMTQHHSLDPLAVLAANNAPTQTESVVIRAKELWDYPDQQVVLVTPF